MSFMISNIVDSNVPFVADRNYAPTRTFITKWDIEIENTRAKMISRRRARDTQYFDYFDDTFPVIVKDKNETLPAAIAKDDKDENDGDDEETRQGWLRSVEAENAYYDRKHGRQYNVHWYDMNQAEIDTDQAVPCNKRGLDFDEHGLFKRVRA